MEQQQRTYEGMIKDWIETYKFCAIFEEQIRAGLIEDTEVEEYLQEKARLIVCLGNLFAVKSIEVKEMYDVEYIKELYAGVKKDLEEQEASLSDFDNAYIDDMILAMEKDFLAAAEETCEKCGKQPCECKEEE